MKRALAIMVAAGILGGCSTAGQYACSAPEGGSCQSLQDVYKSSLERGNNPKSKAGDDQDTDRTVPVLAPSSVDLLPQYVPEGAPIRTGQKILRIWMAPWEDRDGRFHDQSYTYIVTDFGRWVLTRNRTDANGSAFMRLNAPEKARETTEEAKPRIPRNMGADEARAQAIEFARDGGAE